MVLRTIVWPNTMDSPYTGQYGLQNKSQGCMHPVRPTPELLSDTPSRVDQDEICMTKMCSGTGGIPLTNLADIRVGDLVRGLGGGWRHLVDNLVFRFSDLSVVNLLQIFFGRLCIFSLCNVKHVNTTRNTMGG